MQMPRTQALSLQTLLSSLTLMLLLAVGCDDQTSDSRTVSGAITEFVVAYPNKSQTPLMAQGTTHEITYNANGGDVFWIAGQNYDTIAQVALDGTMSFYAMPQGSEPHGLEFD